MCPRLSRTVKQNESIGHFRFPVPTGGLTKILPTTRQVGSFFFESSNKIDKRSCNTTWIFTSGLLESRWGLALEDLDDDGLLYVIGDLYAASFLLGVIIAGAGAVTCAGDFDEYGWW